MLKKLIHPSGHVVIVKNKKMYSLHRYIWEKVHGKISEGFVIHHKDGNPQNNKIDNLELMSFSEHSKRHQILNNSFKNKKHSVSYKEKRALKYTGGGNPNYRKDVSTNLIKELRSKKLNWCEIARKLKMSRTGVKKRFLHEGGVSSLGLNHIKS